MADVEYTNGYHQEDFQDEDITDTNEENSDDEKPRSRSSQNNNNNEDNSMSVDSKPRTLSRDENTAPLRASRHSSTTSDGDDYNNQSASDRRNKWEKKAGRGFSFDKSRVRAQGGSTGASTLKARFENKAIESKKVVTTSNNPNSRLNSEGGENEERHSALSLKARFESKIQDSAPVKRNFVINRTGGAAKKFGGGGGGPVNNKCQVCTKTVYPMEKLEADGHVYHKFCFKCKTCGRTVGLGNYAALQGDIYCKPHLKQLFKLKGNYDEGFGREQRKADWVKKEKNENETNAGGESAPVEGVQDGE